MSGAIKINTVLPQKPNGKTSNAFGYEHDGRERRGRRRRRRWAFWERLMIFINESSAKLGGNVEPGLSEKRNRCSRVRLSPLPEPTFVLPICRAGRLFSSTHVHGQFSLSFSSFLLLLSPFVRPSCNPAKPFVALRFELSFSALYPHPALPIQSRSK